MSGTIDHSNLTLKLDSKAIKTFGLATDDDPVLTSLYSQLFANGTGANQASQQWHSAARSIGASSSETLILTVAGGGSLVNGFGVALTFTAIKILLIHAAAANTNNVLVGAAATHPFTGWVSPPTGYCTVQPGGTLLVVSPAAAGYVVTASSSDQLLITNSGAGTAVVYDIFLLGND